MYTRQKTKSSKYDPQHIVSWEGTPNALSIVEKIRVVKRIEDDKNSINIIDLDTQWHGLWPPI